MRIKLRCPHCGDWFTLQLAIENGEPDSRRTDEGEPEESEPADEPAPRPARRPRARLIGAVCGVAAVVLIVWALVGLRPDRRSGTAVPEEVAALSTEIGAQADRTGNRSPPADGREAPTSREEGDPTGATEDAAGGSAAEAAESGASDPESETSSAQPDGAGPPPSATEVAPVETARTEVGSPPGEVPDAEAAAALEHELLDLLVVATERCWIRVKADGVAVSDLTLDAGERRSWRADGFFELDAGAGDAVRLYLNGEDLGTAGAGPRVVEGLRVTKDGIRGR